MSQPNYSDIEKGKTKPSISQLKKFAVILETTVDALIFEEGERAENKKMGWKENQFSTSKPMTLEDKDFYIRILEDQLRKILK